jgi:hypothetical protein
MKHPILHIYPSSWHFCLSQYLLFRHPHETEMRFCLLLFLFSIKAALDASYEAHELNIATAYSYIYVC